MVTRHAPHAIAALLLAAGLVACRAPGVAPGPQGQQQDADNLRDWNAAAFRMVNGMADQGFIPSAVVPPPGRVPFPPPYYINVVAQGSTFLDEVRKSIERDLLIRGLPVARTPINATVINLDIDVVQWGSDARTELVWRASVLSADRVLMLHSETLSIAASDTSLYVGSTTSPPIASPGSGLLGPTRPLLYAR